MHAPRKGADGCGAQTWPAPHAGNGAVDEHASTCGDHTAGVVVLTGTEAAQLPPVPAGSAIHAKEAWLLTQLVPAETQPDVGMTTAQVVTPHEVMAPT
jgi:hypothetical protein